jgi:hypothetical protein
MPSLVRSRYANVIKITHDVSIITVLSETIMCRHEYNIIVHKKGDTETQRNINDLFYIVRTFQNLYLSSNSDSSEHRISEVVDFLCEIPLAFVHHMTNNGVT